MFELSYIIIAVLLLYLFVKFFSVSLMFLYNGLIGVVFLWIINLFGSFFNLSLEINVINALIAGFFGVPGVIVLLFYYHAL